MRNLIKILDPGKLSRGTRLKEEDRICAEFANDLRRLSLEDKLSCVWFHAMNEGRRGPRSSTIAKALGLIPGVADYIFLGANGCACLEFKSAKGVMSPNQKIFEAWCDHIGVPYAIVRSAKEGLEILAEWDFIKEG